MTIPELFKAHALKAAYIGPFRISAAKNGQTYWVNHRFFKTMGAYGETGIFVGTVKADGSYAGRENAYTGAVRNILSGIALDGIQYLIDNGKELGECQFCGRRLEDAESVAYGYGPVCAKKHNLPHTNRHGF